MFKFFCEYIKIIKFILLLLSVILGRQAKSKKSSWKKVSKKIVSLSMKNKILKNDWKYANGDSNVKSHKQQNLSPTENHVSNYSHKYYVLLI